MNTATRRAALAALRDLERWVDEATAVHARPYALQALFERDAAAVVRAAGDDAALLRRVAARLSVLRARLL